MQKAAFIALVVAVFAGVFLWSGGRAEGSSPKGEIQISRSSDGHFYTTAQVDGHDVRFMIDTGASDVVLSPADAQAAQVAYDPSSSRALGDGASGLVLGQTAHVSRIALGDVEQDDTQVAIVDGAKTSLLGQSFLAQFDEIVIRRGEMRLRSL